MPKEFWTENPPDNENFEDEDSFFYNEVSFEALDELEEPIKNIVLEMKDKLDSGEYSVIIGDDSSGRTPALIFKKVIDHVYKTHNHTLPQLNFIAGFGMAWTDPNIIEHKNKVLLELYKKYSGQTALIVTEYIASGMGLNFMQEALKEAGVKSDVATISTRFSKDRYSSQIDGQLHVASEEANEPRIKGQTQFSGVDKSSTSPFAIRTGGNVTQVRQHLDQISNRIIEWYDNLE